ncbi:MAG: TonB-dependent receptor [Gammaproteobacteria bacterium]|nr:TonB-dependent receptor [Gammaproteobacteria bacterium]
MRSHTLFVSIFTTTFILLYANQVKAEIAEIEEVIVTAQKRAENLQKVPIAVTALIKDTIEKARVRSLDDIARLTPSFLAAMHTPTQPELSIRGIASTDREAGSERSVVVFVDEVYIGRAGASTFDLFDLERIEVLRGPQGTLFGRNVSGGAINIVTAKPTAEKRMKFEGTVGNFNMFEGRGLINGALSDNVNAKASFAARTKDGYYNNVHLGVDDIQGVKSYSARIQLDFLLNEDLQALVTFGASSDDIDGVATKLFPGWLNTVEDFAKYVGSAPPFRNPDGTPYIPPAGMYDVENNLLGSIERSSYSVYSRIDWQQSYGTWTFISAYRYNKLDEGMDALGMGLRGTGPSTRGFASIQFNDETYDALSLELRLASLPENERLNWVVGLYYLNEGVDRVLRFNRQLANGFSAPAFDQSLSTDSYAVFGQFTWAITDRFNLTVGARQTRDEKAWDLGVTDTLSEAEREAIEEDLGRAPGIAPARELYSISTGDSWSEFTPKVALDFRATDDVMLYTSWARGFKSGGWVGFAANAEAAVIPYKPETVDSLEGGIKSQWLNNRLQLNANVFSMDFKEMQQRDTVQLPDGTSIGTIVNVGDAEINGIEAEFVVQASENFRLSGSLSIIDAKVVKTNIANSLTTILKGKDLPRSPDQTFNLSAEYFLPPGLFQVPGEIGLRVDYRYVGDHFFDLNENIAGFQPAYDLWSARIDYNSPDGRWNLAFWGKNLGNEQYLSTAQSFRTPRSLAGTGIQNGFATVGYMGLPRSYGVTLTVNFGS